MSPYFKNELKLTPFSEEEVFIVSKANPCAVWAGTKILYSGHNQSGHCPAASGYNYGSNESDVQPISCSGWGEIRIPELNQLHKIFIFPKNPCIVGRSDYLTLDNQNAPGTSGKPSGTGGCSGKIALIHYKDEGHTSGVAPPACPTLFWCSGLGGTATFNSGIIDVIAFGSQF